MDVPIGQRVGIMSMRLPEKILIWGDLDSVTLHSGEEPLANLRLTDGSVATYPWSRIRFCTPAPTADPVALEEWLEDLPENVC